VNLCTSCEHDFSSVEGFDRHRIGPYAKGMSGKKASTCGAEGLAVNPPCGGRRCLSVDEMTQAQWTKDARGRWVHPREARKRLRRGGDTPQASTNAAPRTRRPPLRPDERYEAITGRSDSR
jgi:hypothetical protein